MVNPTSPPVPTSILGLPLASTPVGAGDFLPIVQGGVTRRVSAGQLAQVSGLAEGAGILITSLGGIQTISLDAPVGVALGGTGSVSAAGARSNLGIGAAGGEGLSGNVVDRSGNLSVDVAASSLFGNITGGLAAGVSLSAAQVLSLLSLSGALIGIQQFAGAGSYTYTPSTHAKAALVFVIGGGGSGCRTNAAISGVGGAGGGMAIGFYTSLSPTAVIIGAGGAGATVDASAGTGGGTSSFGSLLSATGGAGGALSNNGASLGGIGASGISNIRGSSGAGMQGSAANTVITIGGASPMYSGQAINAGANLTGINGIGYGGGGTASSTGNTSGAGADGYCEVWEFGS